GSGRLVRQRRVTPDRVLTLRGADDEREERVVVVPDVHLAAEPVLGLVRTVRVAPGRRRGAARVRPAALDRLVTDLHAVEPAGDGARLEPDLPVALVRAAEEEVLTGVARRGHGVAHPPRPVLVVTAGPE